VPPPLLLLLQVVLAPDPDLAEHLLLHGVMLTHTSYEGDRLQRAFLIQVGFSPRLRLNQHGGTAQH
jgi:hypothetical protein